MRSAANVRTKTSLACTLLIPALPFFLVVGSSTMKAVGNVRVVPLNTSFNC